MGHGWADAGKPVALFTKRARGPGGICSAVSHPERGGTASLQNGLSVASASHGALLLVTLGGRPGLSPRVGRRACTLQDTLQAGSVCLSEKGQRHYLLQRPRTCPGAQAPAWGGASFGGELQDRRSYGLVPSSEAWPQLRADTQKALHIPSVVSCKAWADRKRDGGQGRDLSTFWNKI